MILYGALVEESIAKLFMAGLIPGLVMAGLFMVYIALHAWLRPPDVPAREPAMPWSDRLRYGLHILPIIGLFLAVLGSMYFGIATPTEAAVVGARARSCWPGAMAGLRAGLRDALMATVRTTCMVLFIIIGAQVLTNALTYTGVSRGVSEWIVALELSRWVLFLAPGRALSVPRLLRRRRVDDLHYAAGAVPGGGPPGSIRSGSAWC